MQTYIPITTKHTCKFTCFTTVLLIWFEIVLFKEAVETTVGQLQIQHVENTSLRLLVHENDGKFYFSTLFLIFIQLNPV